MVNFFNKKRSSNPKFFLTKKEREKIVKTIKEAESLTSGEIRIHITRNIKKDIIEDAKTIFEKIGMTNTKERNGVLIYFAIRDRKFAILGDKGIYEKVEYNFWDDIKKGMEEYFKKDNFCDGICYGIIEIGKALKNHFPHKDNDINELPDEISFN